MSQSSASAHQPAPTSGGSAEDGVPGAIATTEDTIALLGFIAFTELTTFTRLAGLAVGAPTPGQHLQLVRLAGDALSRQERILARLTELGADADAEMLGFGGTFADYDERTAPSNWWEAVVKGYVGNGVADDFSRIAVDGLDEQTRCIVVEVLDDNRAAELSVTVLAEIAAQDPALAARLALWGRRLVGEALGLVQHLTTTNAALGRLVLSGAQQRAGAGADQSWVFSQLTSEHTRRMDRLGLAA